MASDLIEHNPALKAPLLAILGLCAGSETYDRSFVEAQAAQQWEETYRFSPSACIDTLVRNNALRQQVFINGQEYGGTLEDAQTDESVSDDAEIEVKLGITEAGEGLLADYNPATTLQALFAEKPNYKEIFIAAIQACNSASGCGLPALEEAIKQFPQLQPNAETGQTSVYPQYFIDALETAGGIVWDGSWRATEAGRAMCV